MNYDKMKDIDLITSVKETIDTLSDLSGTDKALFLRHKLLETPDGKEVFELISMVYSYKNLFYLSRTQVEQNIGYFSPRFQYSTSELLRKLSSMEIHRGFPALSAVCSHILAFPQPLRETLLRLLDKDLKVGVGPETLNKVSKGAVPSFSVPLAKKHKGGDLNGTYFLSRKLDGVRCLAFIKKDSVQFFTREGNLIHSLAHIEKEIKDNLMDYEGKILDGELVFFITGEENFNRVSSEVFKKNHVAEGVSFSVFDVYSIEEFENSKQSSVSYLDVYNDQILKLASRNLKYINPLEQKLYDPSQDSLEIPEGFEGLILRSQTPTVFKRSSNILKIKEFCSETLEVASIELGNKMMQGIDTYCVSSVSVMYKGYRVGVGSGFTDYQRVFWRNNPEELLGSFIEVQFFEESFDKHGNLSLRFPVFKGQRKDMRNPSVGGK